MKVLWIALKDLKLAARDKKGLMLLLVMPIILIAILGSAFSTGFDNTPKLSLFQVGLVDQDRGVMAAALKDVLASTEMEAIIKPVSLTESEARRQISSGKLSAAIIIPEGFSDAIMTGEGKTSLELLKNQADSLRALIVESICRGFVDQVVATQTAVTEMLKEQVTQQGLNTGGAAKNGYLLDPLLLAERISSDLHKNAPQAAEELSTAQAPPSAMQYYSAAMGVMFLLFSGLTGMQSVARERSEQTIARTFAAPTSPTTYLLGKFFGILFIALAQFSILALGTALLFKVHWGAPITVLGVAIAYSWAVSGMALALSAWINDGRAATGAWSVLVQVFSALGGSMVPLTSFPPAMLTVARFTPNFWGLQGLLAGMKYGSFPWSPVLALLAIGSAALIAGGFKVRV